MAMAAIHSTNGIISRGTTGTEMVNTTNRIDYERMMHFILGDLQFFTESWFVTATIPRKQNERVRFEFELPATGAVYEITEFGLQVAGVNNSVGVAQTGGAQVPGIQLGMAWVEGTIKRYGSNFQYNRIAQSVSKRDLRAWGIQSMGVLVAEQYDRMVMGLYDAHAQDVYPLATVTSDTDEHFLPSMVMSYYLLMRLRNYVRAQKLRPPDGMSHFPFILHPDCIGNLFVDPATKEILLATAARKDPMASNWDECHIGRLLCFQFYESNRIPSRQVTTAVAGNTFFVTSGYIVTRDAVACLSMEDSDYGNLPGEGNNRSEETGREEEEWPRPVKTFDHEFGSEGMADMYRNKAAVAELHTSGFLSLQAGRIIRVNMAVGDTQPGVAVGAGSGGFSHAGTAGPFLAQQA